MGEIRVGPEGQYGGCIHELIAIGRIVLDGLDDLRTQVEGETWPPHRGRELANCDVNGIRADAVRRDSRPADVAFCWKRDRSWRLLGALTIDS